MRIVATRFSRTNESDVRAQNGDVSPKFAELLHDRSARGRILTVKPIKVQLIIEITLLEDFDDCTLLGLKFQQTFFHALRFSTEIIGKMVTHVQNTFADSIIGSSESENLLQITTQFFVGSV